MNTTTHERYNGWKIEIGKENNMCSSFSFDITDPSGKTQHVTMGGDTEERALERAKEMIDLENDFASDN